MLCRGTPEPDLGPASSARLPISCSNPSRTTARNLLAVIGVIDSSDCGPWLSNQRQPHPG